MTITYLFPDGTDKEQTVEVPAFFRSTVNVNEAVEAGKEVSVKIESDLPIVAERPMYFIYNGWDGGHDVAKQWGQPRTWDISLQTSCLSTACLR